MEDKKYTYYAFISYKHDNEKWAKWLQRNLQSYRLPIKTSKKYKNLPSRLIPVFYDKNLRPGILDDKIKDEISDSKFLIVICSKEACAKPEWLDKEIQFFLENGGDISRIIPVIVDKSDDPVEETFPPYLKKLNAEKPILGVNVPKSGKRKAILLLVSTMQGIKYEELESEDSIRLRTQRIIYACISLFVLICGFFCWDYFFRIKTKYYVDITDVYGVPKGIGELSKKDMTGLDRHFVIITKQGKVRELRSENSYGELVDPFTTLELERYARSVYTYKENGELSEVTYQNANGLPILEMKYYNRNTVDLAKPQTDALGGFGASSYLTSHSAGTSLYSKNSELKSNVSRYLIIYDENGYVRETYFASNSSNHIGTDSDGISGKKYVRDQLGRATNVYYLTYTGKKGTVPREEQALKEEYSIIGNRLGISEIAFTYDENYDLTGIFFFDKDREPKANDENVYGWVTKYKNHNAAEEIAVDGNGELIISIYGFASRKVEFDDRGDEIKESYFGINGEPVYSEEEGASILESEYDDRGNMIKTCYYGINGEPVLNIDGVFMRTGVYDERGNRLVENNYDLDGNFVINRYGYATSTAEFDEHSNIIKASFFGTNGEPVLIEDGYSIWKPEYDENGNQVKASFFGTDGNPVINDYGFSSTTREFDERGNGIKISFFGINGEPIIQNDGYAGWESEFDERGNEIKARYFGTNGEPVFGQDGYAGWESEYDVHGNRIKGTYIGLNGEPVIQNDGYAVCKSEYDERGNEIKESFFGINGEPIVNYYGFAVMSIEYDDRGNETQITYYDLVDNPIAKMSFFENGNINSEIYYNYDEDGKLSLSDEGFAVTEYIYDEDENQISEVYYGINEEVLEEFITDPEKKITEHREFHYDKNGKLSLSDEDYAIKESIHDEHGNEIKVIFFGTNNEPVLNSDGYAFRESEYDERGNEIRARFFGINGEPVLFDGDFSIWESEYNENGEKISESNYGLNHELTGKIVFDPESKITKLYEYNYDEDGKLTVSDDGYAVCVSAYNKYDEQLSEAYYGINEELLSILIFDPEEKTTKYYEYNYGEDGEPALTDDGYAIFVSTFDKNDEKTSESYYGVNEEPLFVYLYDPESMVSKYFEYNYDQNGNLALSDDDGAIIETAYDKYDDQLSEAYYGVNKEPLLIMDHDPESETIKIFVYNYDENGKPALTEDGFAVMELDYDETGKQTDEKYYGLDEIPVPDNHGLADVEAYFESISPLRK